MLFKNNDNYRDEPNWIPFMAAILIAALFALVATGLGSGTIAAMNGPVGQNNLQEPSPADSN